jgi:hypothetical protein
MKLGVIAIELGRLLQPNKVETLLLVHLLCGHCCTHARRKCWGAQKHPHAPPALLLVHLLCRHCCTHAISPTKQCSYADCQLTTPQLHKGFY